jgi:integrase
MRVDLRGVHATHAKLANGIKVVYWYAWRGGPRLRGEPGTPDFIASYNEAVAQRTPIPGGTLQTLFDAYQRSQKFLGREPRTRADYVKQITKNLEPEFGDFPIKALTARETRGVFLDWRDRLALKSLRQADYAWMVLALILAWAKDRGKISVNPCERGGRLYDGTRVDFVWTIEDEAAFLKYASAHLRLPLLLALWTGQRQGDLLRLPWSSYDGSHIRLRQGKTGARVNIPVGAPLKAELDQAAMHKCSPLILVNSLGRPWTQGGFRSSWGDVCKKAGIVDLTFNDLRGTAVTRLALAGCSEPEIASITGHSLRDVRSILDTHYLRRDPALAENAIRKLEQNALATPNDKMTDKMV